MADLPQSGPPADPPARREEPAPPARPGADTPAGRWDLANTLKELTPPSRFFALALLVLEAILLLLGTVGVLADRERAIWYVALMVAAILALAILVFSLERGQQAQLGAAATLRALEAEWKRVTGFPSPPATPDSLPNNCAVASGLPDLWHRHLAPALQKLGFEVEHLVTCEYLDAIYQVSSARRERELVALCYLPREFFLDPAGWGKAGWFARLQQVMAGQFTRIVVLSDTDLVPAIALHELERPPSQAPVVRFGGASQIKAIQASEASATNFLRHALAEPR